MQLETVTLSVVLEERYVFVVVLLLLFAASATLNGTVMIVFKWNRLIRTVNNSMVANLAVSDFLFVSLSCLTSVVSILHGDDWLQRQFLCRFIGYCNHLFQSVSAYTCALISFHRFISIVIPHRKLFGHPRCSRRVTVALWTCTMLTLLPSAMRETAYQLNPVLATCTHFGYQTGGDSIFSMYSVGINFVLPLFLMVVFYTRIYRTVVRHKMSIVKDIGNAEVVERKSKRLMVAVLGIFSVTWAPYSAVLLFSACSTGTPLLPNLVVYVAWLLNLLNTFFHPLLYAVCNRMYLRCIVRFLRCRGPIRNVAVRAVSPLSQRSCYATSNKVEEEEEEEEEEISTIAPLPGYKCHLCLSCAKVGDSYCAPAAALITNGTQTASRFCVDQEKAIQDDGTAAYRPGCKFSSCSHCSLGAYSTRSSVPTVMRLPFRRYRRSASNSSQVSHFGCGPTSVDSGRSSFASQYVTTPGPCSARPSLATPASARTSTVSQYVQHSTSNSTTSFTDRSSQRQRTGRHGIQRVASDSSRQSIFSSYSALRSVRSSMSSRISHYLRMSHSTRSSVTSQCTSAYLPTPFSTRPNSPNAELELLYMSGCSPRTTRQGSLFSRRSSSGTDSRYSSRISCLQIPESSMDIYEDIEPSASDDESQTLSGNNSPKMMSPCQSPGSNYDKVESRRTSSTCHRISVFMLGDFEQDDPTAALMDDRSTEVSAGIGRAFWSSSSSVGKKPGSASTRARKAFRISRSGASPPSPRQQQQSPCHLVTDPHGGGGGGSRSPVRCSGEATSDAHQAAIDSMNKAVGVILSAKRLTAKARSAAVFPFKPDTPVPELQPTIQIHRIPVKEPMRFVYEGPRPTNYYSFGAQKPMMSHLRVPGRPPNVPQTIIEEDQVLPPSPTDSSSRPETPSTPSTRRRKNASSWIAPPIIDVMEVDDYRSKDMRVECPGVLVEHHT